MILKVVFAMTVYFKHSTADENTSVLDQKVGVSTSVLKRRGGFYRAAGKPLFDYILVLASLPVVLPLVVLLALLISLDGASPFFRQRRVGRNGKVFHILKLRTMVPDAEQTLQTHLKNDPEARQEWDHKQKLRHDPRITWLGKVLRKASFDELPQLWNVLRGEMSLIGPRPMMVEQKELYPNAEAAYYRLRPGITGLWQVSDRNLSSFTERSTFDIKYYNGLSFGMDLSIFMRTISVVLRGTGY
jgi:exopolysaccharide production protein ExoY